MWFVEASADCSLEGVNNLELPLVLRKEELLPFAPLQVNEEDLIFMMQVNVVTLAFPSHVSTILYTNAKLDQYLRSSRKQKKQYAELVVYSSIIDHRPGALPRWMAFEHPPLTKRGGHFVRGVCLGHKAFANIRMHGLAYCQVSQVLPDAREPCHRSLLRT